MFGSFCFVNGSTFLMVPASFGTSSGVRLKGVTVSDTVVGGVVIFGGASAGGGAGNDMADKLIGFGATIGGGSELSRSSRAVGGFIDNSWANIAVAMAIDTPTEIISFRRRIIYYR